MDFPDKDLFQWFAEKILFLLRFILYLFKNSLSGAIVVGFNQCL